MEDNYTSMKEIMEQKKEEIEKKFMPIDTTKLEENIKKVKDTIRKVGENIAKNSTFVMRILRSAVLKKDKETKEELKSELKTLKEDLQQIEIKNNEIEVQKEEELEKYKSVQKTIDTIKEENPSVTEDINFVKAAIDVDYNNINLVKDSSDPVANKAYVHLIQDTKNTLLSEQNLGDNAIMKEQIDAHIDEACEELNNPKEVEEGKYKIPHKYLRESISKGMDKYCDDVIDHPTSANPDFVGTTIAEYKEYDGKVRKETGEELEKMYDDKDYYLYVHNIAYGGQHYSEEEIQSKIDSICTKGLRLTSPGNEFGKINYTTFNTHDDKHMDFTGFLRPLSLDTGTVVLQIPKELVDKNEGFVGWVKEEVDGRVVDELYISPEYVKGFTYKGKYKKNTVPKELFEERKNDFYKMTGEYKEKEYIYSK